jgi:hypothetical protein
MIDAMVISGEQVREALRVLRITEYAKIEDVRKVTVHPGMVEAEIILRDGDSGNALVAGDDIAMALIRFPIRWGDLEPAGADMPARGAGIPDRWPL